MSSSQKKTQLLIIQMVCYSDKKQALSDINKDSFINTKSEKYNWVPFFQIISMLTTKLIGNEITEFWFCLECKNHFDYYLLILELGITLRSPISVSQPKGSFFQKAFEK